MIQLPKIKAEFILDDDNKPKGCLSGHYGIKLHAEDVPDNAYKVTYQLDSSYYDPVREVIDRNTGFSEEITSYGDYVVQAKIRTNDQSIISSRSLFDALYETHGDSSDPLVQKALKDIKDN